MSVTANGSILLTRAFPLIIAMPHSLTQFFYLSKNPAYADSGKIFGVADRNSSPTGNSYDGLFGPSHNKITDSDPRLFEKVGDLAVFS